VYGDKADCIYDAPAAKANREFGCVLRRSDEQFDFYECKYFDRKITVKECRQEKAQLEKIRGIQVADMRFVCTDGFTFEDEHEFILIDGKTLYSSF